MMIVLNSIGLLVGISATPDSDSLCRQYAVEAAQWIRQASIHHSGMRSGMDWPADPKKPESVNATLYGGSPGVVLFLLQMYRQTGESLYLAEAKAGAGWLLETLDSQKESGLYEGLAGIGFVLEETYRATKDRRFRDGALKCADIIHDRAMKTGNGVQWSDTTDIISGSAGTGLFLLYMARDAKRPDLKQLAVSAGQRLLELGKPDRGGLYWAMDSTFPRLMPNFSHGTAGVAYFLATLYRETSRKEFLDAAIKGASYLTGVANTDGDGCKVYHHEPDGKDLYYLGWCHGPVGTARLFYRLYQVTGDKKWMTWVERCAKSIMDSGIPEKLTPGFWNNCGQCCGLAGVGEFFLNLHKVTKKPEYLAFCRRVNDRIIEKAAMSAQGVCWIDAEHRVMPDLLIAQTGYMQGAAGIGSWLLRYSSYRAGKEIPIRLPDNPFE